MAIPTEFEFAPIKIGDESEIDWHRNFNVFNGRAPFATIEHTHDGVLAYRATYTDGEWESEILDKEAWEKFLDAREAEYDDLARQIEEEEALFDTDDGGTKI